MSMSYVNSLRINDKKTFLNKIVTINVYFKYL